jgi:choline transport protein
MKVSDDKSSNPPHTDMAVEALDADAYHLAQLGYKQELERNFSQWSLISFGVTLTATWAAMGGALAGGIYAGGPAGVIYGFILTLVGQCFVGATIAELASSYPTTGGWKMLS